jgi:hypothetical protein
MWEANPIKKHCTWEGAFKRINNLNLKKLGGHSDWRLPNINELNSLVSYSYNQHIRIWLNKNGFKIVSGIASLWTSSYLIKLYYTVDIPKGLDVNIIYFGSSVGRTIHGEYSRAVESMRWPYGGLVYLGSLAGL